MTKLQEIKNSLTYGAEVEGTEYAHKSLTLEDVHWLVSQVEKLQKNEREDLYKDEGMAIFVKGKMRIGIHPDNLINNLEALKKGDIVIDWGAESFGIEVNNNK